MNIFIYCDDTGTGGTAINAALLAEDFISVGHRVILLAGDRDNPYAVAGVRQARLGYDPLRFSFKARLSRSEPEALFWSERPDLVFYCDAAPDSSLAAKAVCRDWGIPYLVLVNWAPPTMLPEYAQHLDAIARAYADALAVVAVSSQNLHVLRAQYHVPQDRSYVVYNGRPRTFLEAIPADQRVKVRQSLGLEPEDILCVTVARFEQRKGYDHLLEAVARLAERPDTQRLRYAWIGHDVEGGRDRLTREVTERGLGSRICVVGQRDDVRDWLGAADVFVLSSESEGMPLSIIEAMGQALPIVATAVGGIPEQLGDTGILLPDPLQDRQGTVAALLYALAALVADPAGRQGIGRACRQRAVELFSAEAMQARYRGLVAQFEPAVRAARPRYPDHADLFPNALQPGHIIRMGQDVESIEYLKNGWSHAEGEGRWTDGDRAVMTFCLPADACCGYVVQFEVEPFLGKGDVSLVVTLSFCGRELGQLSWPPLPKQKSCFAFAFFSGGQLPTEGEFVLAIAGASSPCSHGLSNDARRLGLWFTSLRFDRLLAAR